MARSRNIKPGFFANDRLAECSPLARLLFVGLWTIADREGRLEDRAKRIRAEILPYDDCEAHQLLNELYCKGFITRYESGGNKYIQVINFIKHQNPHVKEGESTIPVPDNTSSTLIQAEKIPEQATPLTDSLLLIPDSLKPIDMSVCVATDPLGLVNLDYKSLVQIWNETAGQKCTQVKKLTANRKVILRARMRDSFENDLKQWRLYCETIRDDPFLTGGNNRGWRADFDWATKEANVVKVLEGKYEQIEPTVKFKKSATDLAIEEVMRNAQSS